MRVISAIKPIFYLAFSMFISGCNHDNVVDNWPGGLINKPGTYTHESSHFKIVVKDVQGLLKYQVYDANSRLLLASNRSPSIYQRWAMYWDSKNNFWVASSDIGGVVWVNNKNNVYESLSIPIAVQRNLRIPDELAFAIRHKDR